MSAGGLVRLASMRMWSNDRLEGAGWDVCRICAAGGCGGGGNARGGWCILGCPGAPILPMCIKCCWNIVSCSSCMIVSPTQAYVNGSLITPSTKDGNNM